MKRTMAILLAVVMLLSLSVAGAEEAKAPRFAWINPNIGNPVGNLYDEGVRAAAADYGIEVDIIGCLNGQGSSETYAEQIEIAIAADYDGIITYCGYQGAATEALVKAREAGIPVVNVMMDPGSEDAYDTFIALDGDEMGKMLADNIAQACGEEGNLLFTQTFFWVELQNMIREKTYAHLEATYPNMAFVESGELTQDSQKQAELYVNLMTAHPDVVGLVVVDSTGGPNGARMAQEMGLDNFKVCCIDDTDDALDLIRKGLVTSTIAQGGPGMLYDSVRLLYEHCVEGKELPKLLGVPMLTVTAENVDTYYEEMLKEAHLKGTEWNY